MTTSSDKPKAHQIPDYKSHWDVLPRDVKELIRYLAVDYMRPTYFDRIRPILQTVHDDLREETFCVYYSLDLAKHAIGPIFSSQKSRRWHLCNVHDNQCLECFEDCRH